MQQIAFENIEWNNDFLTSGLRSNETHIVKIEIDSYYQKIKDLYPKILSINELIKTKSFHFFKEEKQYIVTRHSLRSLLSHFLDIKPAAITFTYKENKKPSVNGIEFNVSHSGNYLIIAFSQKAIGVDIELVDQNFDYNSLKEICFNSAEQELLNDRLAFYYMWTRKESLLKATGEGLVDNLSHIEGINKEVCRHQINYAINSFAIADDYVFSLTHQNSNTAINYWNYL